MPRKPWCNPTAFPCAKPLGNPEPGLDSQQAQGTLKMSLQGRPENNTINITASPDGPRCTLQHHGLHTHNTHWDLCVRTQGVYLHRARTRRQRASSNKGCSSALAPVKAPWYRRQTPTQAAHAPTPAPYKATICQRYSRTCTSWRADQA